MGVGFSFRAAKPIAMFETNLILAKTEKPSFDFSVSSVSPW